MQTLILTKAFPASIAVAKHRLLTLNSDGSVAQATNSNNVLIGVSSDVDTPVGGVCDAHLLGIADVEAAGVITAGSTVTCDAQGRASATTTANRWVVGIALQSTSAAGDIFSVLLQPLKQ